MIKKILLSIFLLPLVAFTQHTIEGTFSPAADYSLVLLYHVLPTKLVYKTNANIDPQGAFTIRLDSSITRGMYRLVYAVPQDLFNFDIIYSGTEDIELRFDSNTGVEYTVSEENLLLASYEKEMLALKTQISERYKEGNRDVSELFETLKQSQNDFENEAQGTIAFEFIKANRPYIPESFQSIEAYIASNKEYYFKNFDANNKTLQESSFITNYAYNFILGFAGKNDRTAIENNIDTFNEQVRTSNQVFQKALWTNLHQKFIDADRTQLANYISEKYLMPLARQFNDYDLIEALTLFKNTSIGNKAPNFSWEEVVDNRAILKNLHDINTAGHYIIVFWSSGCSHCLKEVPALYAKVSLLKQKNYKVIAIGLEDKPYAWRNKIQEFPEFINVLGLGKWQNEIARNYGVNATPTYFILDENKKITAKPQGLDDILKLLSKKANR